MSFDVTLTPRATIPCPSPTRRRAPTSSARALRGKWAGVEVCYKQGLDKRHDLGGRMELKFRVKPNREAVEILEGDTHFSDVDVARCVTGVFKGAKFQRTGSRRETTFVYALHLEAITAGATTVASAAKPSDSDDDDPPPPPRRRRRTQTQPQH